jgi:DNA polymerase-3 subunit epsilon
MRQLIVDTETTGLSPDSGHRIIEFAALESINRELTGNYLHIYIDPEREIDIAATKIHGIRNHDLFGKPVFANVKDQIAEYITGAELIIHNAKFDVGFLDYQLQQHGMQPVMHYAANVVDTLAIARIQFPGSKNNLNALCDRFNIDRSNRSYHGALIDCQLLFEIYLLLTKQQISLLGNDETNCSKSFKKLSDPKILDKLRSTKA